MSTPDFKYSLHQYSLPPHQQQSSLGASETHEKPVFRNLIWDGPVSSSPPIAEGLGPVVKLNGARGPRFVEVGTGFSKETGRLGENGTVEQIQSIGNDNGKTGGKKRRGNLPKSTTHVLKTWFNEHLEYPYPSESQKDDLAAQTSLTLNQISNWFINARRRILPPAIAAANLVPKESGERKKSFERRKSVERRNSFGLPYDRREKNERLDVVGKRVLQR